MHTKICIKYFFLTHIQLWAKENSIFFHRRLEPCPFGLRKWVDPVVAIFFKNAKKITSVGWSSRCKFFWYALDPKLVIFLEMKKKISPKKFQVWDQGTNQIQQLYFFSKKNYKCWLIQSMLIISPVLFSVLPKTAWSAQTVKNPYIFFNVS